MPRFVAFLRGVSPLNAKMPELKRCFESAGFSNVKTLLSSGNVAFDDRSRSIAAIERKAEAAMHAMLGRSFCTIVRPTAHLQQMLASDPFAAHELAPAAKRVVIFMRDSCTPEPALPLSRDDASILCLQGREAFAAYVPHAKGPMFMKLIENTFGTAITTRTWDTVRKSAAA